MEEESRIAAQQELISDYDARFTESYDNLETLLAGTNFTLNAQQILNARKNFFSRKRRDLIRSHRDKLTFSKGGYGGLCKKRPRRLKKN